MSKSPLVSFIYVADRANTIATNDNVLSFTWNSKEDKKRFKEVTLAAGVIVCGYSTFVTFGKPLVKRLNVVYTRKPELLAIPATDELMYTDMSPEDLIRHLSDKGFKEIVICGGEEIYALFWETGMVDRIYLTIEPLTLSGTERFFMPFFVQSALEDGTVFDTLNLP